MGFTEGSSPHPDSILLVSGSLPFIKRWNLQAQGPVLVLCDEHVRQRQFIDGQLRWSQVRHVTFGGVTQFQTLVGTNIPDFEPTRTTLRRTLEHIIDYSLKPRWSPAPGAHNSSLTVKDRLHPDDLGREVCYHTHYSGTGWGTRRLSNDELGIAFGWPAWARKANQDHPSFPCVPVQIMDGLLKSLVLEAPSLSLLRTPTPRPSVGPCDRTWLPLIQRFLPHSWVDSSLVTEKAAKRDDARVPTHLWDQRCSLVIPHCMPALPTLRMCLARTLVTRLWEEFRGYLSTTHGPDWQGKLGSHKTHLARARKGRFLGKRTRGDRDKDRDKDKDEKGETESPHNELAKDVIAGVDAIGRFDKADWWAWKEGSTLLYWRWPAGEQRQSARDGMSIWIRSKLPRHQQKARPPDPLKKELIRDKLQKILDRRYVVAPVTVGFIRSLMEFFDVRKDDDIRLVYNGTSCGLNDALWAPNFWLPTPATAARSLGYGYYMADIDLGEMFLNFPLHEILQRFSGIDLSHYSEAEIAMWVHWTRCWMGLKPSPYMAVRFYYWAEEFARGDRRAPTNALRWDLVKLNLLGDPAYDPTLPRVMKWDSSIENIAGDLVAFVDDLRASGHSIERTWAISRQIVSRLQYLGIQDAPRKRRPPVCTPGACAGSVFITTDSEVR